MFYLDKTPSANDIHNTVYLTIIYKNLVKLPTKIIFHKNTKKKKEEQSRTSTQDLSIYLIDPAVLYPQP